MSDLRVSSSAPFAERAADGQSTRRKALKRIAAASLAGGVAAATAAGQSAGGPTAATAGSKPAVSGGAALARFDAADPTLPHGGVKPSNTGEQNDAAIDELFRRARAAGGGHKYIQMPPGVLQFGATISPSGKTPGRGERANYWQIDFPATRIVAVGESANYMPIQLCDAGGKFFDMDHFPNNRAGEQQVPWSKSLDTIWIQNDDAGTLKKMRAFFNCRNCECLRIGGTLTIDGNDLPDLVALASTGGGGGRTGMFRGMIDNLHIQKAAVGILAGNFGASPDNTGIADHFTDVTIGLLDMVNGVKVGFVGHSNHFDNLTVDKLSMSCPYNSYLCTTHNITIGSGFLNVPKSTKSQHQLVLMGTNLRMCCIYFNSGGGPPWPSAGHILISEKAVLDIQYHNDISKATTTGCHLAMGQAPSGVQCRTASLVARVDIRSVNGVKKPAASVNPGMLWLDTQGGAACRRQIELHLASTRPDYDIVKIDGKVSTNDKITLYDVRDDVNYGKTFKISDGKLKLWG